MRNPVRIGLIGAGMIGRKHAAYVSASPNADLVAVADPYPEARACAIQQQATYYPSFEGMLSSEELDGVIIAAPNELHEAAGIATAQRGLPMIIEKPIAADLSAASRLTAAAEKAGVPLLVGHHRRYNPRAQTARRLVQDGSLGHLVAVNVTWCVRKPDPYFKAAWKTLPGGGPILINLIHEIDLLRFICGEITEVMALSSNAIRGFDVEDSTSIALRFENGALGTVLISDTAPSPWTWEQATGENHPTFPANEENPARFFGTNAAMEFPRLTIWRHQTAIDWNHPIAAETVSLPMIDVYAEQIAHFVRVIRDEEEPIITGKDASQSLAATLAVIEAAETRKAVRPRK
ncbi:MAG: Gfo/Idh/MocA family oxidoreductase [Pseudomonadota bacterium]